MLALSVIEPSAFSIGPSEKPRDGQTSDTPLPIEPSISSVEGVRCHATSTPSSDGSEMVSALPESAKRVLAPPRSKCALPVTSSPAIAAGDGLEIDGGALLDQVEAQFQRNARGAWRRLEADQRQRLARVVAHHRAFAGEGKSSRLQRSLAAEGDAHRPVSSAALPVILVFGTPESLTVSLPWLLAGGGEALDRKVREQQHEKGLRPLAGDAAVDGDLRLAGLGGIAKGAGDERHVGAAGLAAQFDRGAGGLALAGGDQADLDIERRQRRKMLRPAHALGQSEQIGGDAQAVGGGGRKREIDPARRRLRSPARCGLCR